MPFFTNQQNASILTILTILAYCILHALVRLSLSDTMDWDEFEQFLNAANLNLGDGRQPPLYSWIIFSFAKIFGMHAELVIGMRYLILFIFHTSFYFLSRVFFEQRTAVYSLLALMLLPLYSYTLTYKLTHTALVSAIAALSCLSFFKLVAKPKAFNYFIFGVCLALGFLSKYNFIFLLVPLILSCLSSQIGRRLLFNWKVLLSLASGSLVLGPHAIWLYKSQMSSINYALERAEAGGLTTHNLGASIFEIFHYSIEPLAFTAIIVILFYKFKASPSSISVNHDSIKLLRLLALYSLIFPPILILGLRMEVFCVGWLAPVYFLIPLALFTYIDWSAVTKQRKLIFLYLCILALVLVLSARTILSFMPDQTDSLKSIHAPYQEASSKFKEALNSYAPDAIIITNNMGTFANLKAKLPDLNLYRIEDYMTAQDLLSSTKDKILVWDVVRQRKKNKVPKKIRRAFPNLENIQYVKLPYLYSKKEFSLAYTKIN